MFGAAGVDPREPHMMSLDGDDYETIVFAALQEVNQRPVVSCAPDMRQVGRRWMLCM